MPEDRTVLDHLRDGRDALLQEVTRLTAAIEQLDSVLGRIGASDRSDGHGSTARADELSGGPTMSSTVSGTSADATQTTVGELADEPVNSPAEVEPVTLRSAAKKAATKAAVRPTKRAPAKAAAKSPAKKASPRAVTGRGEPPKSIRVHVLEMLAAENRDFGLAEIIDRVHGAGIQAHDDAVRSITIKLMKDGRVERVGRGQYRLARRGAAARAASAATATAPRVTETAPEPPAASVEPAAPAESLEPAEVEPVESAAAVEAAQTPSEPEPDPVDEAEAPDARNQDEAMENSDQPQSNDDVDRDDEPNGAPGFSAVSVPASYTPPLNLGQPWSGGK